MQCALLSVWDKRGITDLARILVAHDVAILTSGGTAQSLRGAGIPFTEVSEYTGSPEMMDGRVKTLHPRIHGGLLGRRGTDDAVMAAHGIRPIDLLVVNLYPFEEMAVKGLSPAELVEYIDVGGPAMIRAAAKNHRDVAVVVDPSDYPLVEDALRRGGFSADERFGLARKAFARTAAYDAAISNTFYAVPPGEPGVITLQFAGGRPLRYGENPHQQGFVFGTSGVAGAVPVQGKPMSFNNYLDLHAAISLVREFTEPCAVIVKHNNPCGVATGETIADAYLSAREIDPDSAYGSVVALNREVDLDLSREICATYVEVVAAPAFSPESLGTMAGKANMRVVALPAPSPGDEIRSIDGGILLQRTPAFREEWKVVSDRDPTPREMRAMQIAWKVCAATRSNSIVFADQDRVIGIGAGQMSRVDAARIAVMKARFPLKNTAVASDAFLPFADTLEVAAEAGATALVQPGGSIRDEEVVAAANRRQIAMVFTGIRHFRH